ncbi:Chitin bind 4 domain containing protein, partial [Asbolus verrucosus]
GSVHYKFEYRVSDPHTGDEKSQFEHRDGKQVKGGYTLKEADGTTRIVEYESDPHDGFNAVVKRIGHAQHPAHYKNEEGDKHGGTSYIGITHYGYGH